MFDRALHQYEVAPDVLLETKHRVDRSAAGKVARNTELRSADLTEPGPQDSVRSASKTAIHARKRPCLPISAIWEE